MAEILNSDHASIERQIFVRKIIAQYFYRETGKLDKLGRDSNNFVYLVTLGNTIGANGRPSKCHQRPGVTTLSSDTLQAVIRLSNPAALLNEESRVQSEVAAMSLFRNALAKSGLENLVPLVYGWEPSMPNSKQGWILMEHRPGTPLDEVFPALTRKEEVLQQIAEVYRAIQAYELPLTVKGFGGLAFDEFGAIASGPTTIPCGGPFTSLAAMHQGMLYKQLELASSPQATVVKGWKGSASNLSSRLQAFASKGLVKLVERNSESRPTLVHGDFDLQNLLVESTSNRLTALLDFDFAHVASIADEYMLSFNQLSGIVVGPYEDDDDYNLLRRTQLDGFPQDKPVTSAKERSVDWEAAVMFHSALTQAGARRPCDIHGMDEYSTLIWFLQDISPPYLMMERWLAKRTPEQVQQHRDSVEKKLDESLRRWGF